MRNLYPHRTAKRDSLMELRWRHLDQVDSMARGDSSLDELYATLLKNFEHFYGPLRKRKRDEVPSDATRRAIMIMQIVNLVEERRAELESVPRLSGEALASALAAAPNEYVEAAILYENSRHGAV